MSIVQLCLGICCHLFKECFFQGKQFFKEGGGYKTPFSLAAGKDELCWAEVGTEVGLSLLVFPGSFRLRAREGM